MGEWEEWEGWGLWTNGCYLEHLFDDRDGAAISGCLNGYTRQGEDDQ